VVVKDWFAATNPGRRMAFILFLIALPQSDELKTVMKAKADIKRKQDEAIPEKVPKLSPPVTPKLKTLWVFETQNIVA
ncbi:unnamed protein product, partial [Allacma fusca]